MNIPFAKKLVDGDDLLIDSSLVGVVRGKDIRLDRGGAGVVLASGDMQMNQGGGQVMAAGGDMPVAQGGGGLMFAGGDMSISQGGGGILVAGGEARVDDGTVGVLLAPKVVLGNNTRVLVSTPQAIIIGIVAGAVIGLLAAYFRQVEREAKRKDKPLDMVARWLGNIALKRIGIR